MLLEAVIVGSVSTFDWNGDFMTRDPRELDDTSDGTGHPETFDSGTKLITTTAPFPSTHTLFRFA